jgi:16S rRNA (adenine1518-N6/adenine1519-N6)-dimethyltransferase
VNAHRHEAEAAGEAATPRLLGPAEIRDLAELLDVTPTKKLGQNFVHDGNTVRRIVHVAGVQRGESVLEIGPGLGSLTLGLLEAGASVIAVEIDHRLAEQLPHTVAIMQPGTPITVVRADALRSPNCPARRCGSSRTSRTTSRCRCCCTCSSTSRRSSRAS